MKKAKKDEMPSFVTKTIERRARNKNRPAVDMNPDVSALENVSTEEIERFGLEPFAAASLNKFRNRKKTGAEENVIEKRIEVCKKAFKMLDGNGGTVDHIETAEKYDLPF